MVDEELVMSEYKSHMYVYACTSDYTVKLICKNICLTLGYLLSIPRKDTMEEMNRYA